MVEYDILIIGAGIAGLYCAHCLEKNSKIGILTNRPIGSHKPCGGLFSPRANEYISQLRLGANHYYDPNPVSVDIIINNSVQTQEFYNVKREELEKEMYARLETKTTLHISKNFELKKSGDTFLVRNKKTNETYCSPILIAADGVNSSVRRKLGYRKASTIVVEQFYTKNILKHARLVLNRAISPDYYYWLIPKGEYLVGGYNLADKDKVLQNIRETHPDMDLSENCRREIYPLTKIRTTEEIELGEGNVFFIGEAAGLVMPSSGEGITSALESAKNIAEALHSPQGMKNEVYKELMKPRVDKIRRDLNQRPSVLKNP